MEGVCSFLSLAEFLDSSHVAVHSGSELFRVLVGWWTIWDTKRNKPCFQEGARRDFQPHFKLINSLASLLYGYLVGSLDFLFGLKQYISIGPTKKLNFLQSGQQQPSRETRKPLLEVAKGEWFGNYGLSLRGLVVWGFEPRALVDGC